MEMKLIYVAGKYRDNRGAWWIRENIRAAEKAAQFIWQRGGAALCPHKNTAFMDGLPGCPDEVWLKGDLVMLSRCDAVYALENWQDSIGATAEITYAREKNIPVLFSYQDIIDFLLHRI
jgi:hypothetical protein